MNRFRLLPKATALLANQENLMIFLDNSGCVVFEKWLQPNPDETFPPLQVVEFCLSTLQRLPIELEHLQECEIARALQVYACDKPAYGKAVAQEATHLL